MTTFVTGGSGHLGANLVRTLLARGEKVRALVRKDSDNSALDGLDVELAYTDLRDPKGLRHAMDGCDRAYHCAAFVSIRNIDRDRLFQVNVLGTRNIMEAARAVNMKRVVHCSSFGAVGKNPNGASNEKWMINPFDVEMDYERSKAFAEIEVLRAALDGLDVTIVNPSGIIGPCDFRLSMIGKTMLDFAAGKMRYYIPGAFDFVPSRDVVQGHLLAMEHGKRGERYLLTGEVVTLHSILGWWADWMGHGKRPIALPPALIEQIAAIKDWFQARFFPEQLPRFNRNSIRLLNSGKHGSNEKAQRELGLTPTPVEHAFREQFDWFVEQKKIAPPSSWQKAIHPADQVRVLPPGQNASAAPL